MTINQEGQLIIYLSFYLFLIAVGYQYFRFQRPYLSSLIGLIIIAVIVILYTVGKIFFPHSPFTPTFLPPSGLLLCIYYLSYFHNRRNRILTALAIIFIIIFVIAYLISL